MKVYYEDMSNSNHFSDPEFIQDLDFFLETVCEGFLPIDDAQEFLAGAPLETVRYFEAREAWEAIRWDGTEWLTFTAYNRDDERFEVMVTTATGVIEMILRFPTNATGRKAFAAVLDVEI